MKKLIVLMALFSLLTGCGCSTTTTDPNAPADGNTVGDTVDQGMDDAGNAVQDGMDKAGDAVENGMDNAGDTVTGDTNTGTNPDTMPSEGTTTTP